MVQLTPVSEDNKEVLYNLYQLYHYDFSQFSAIDINGSGLYEISLEHYWQDPRWNPFFIYCADKIVGFLVVLFENYDVDPDPTHVIYDFLVLRKFRRNGIGKEAAVRTFDLYKANWKVAQKSSNEPAILFWRHVIREYTGDRYTELFRQDLNKYVQTFSTKGS
ncbi:MULTISPECIES: GNAT family N-acetyltransferase [unclassified Paenibacillus]|uniref:GNAT family N-acetyltransferase n=1 Tax=unclassified Paenibacillus TaxID=185978 RepID=UPI0027881DA5|nr:MULTISPECIES: GNAT family N-acetyltransferase [unclassified Paenibacillus]MDQ0899338.1 putative acetyltransferase [Paenibacillus sp. V4I7]MDQ0914683.1 putative acetyltransferase [Paenibacillus sp. V4I5]